VLVTRDGRAGSPGTTTLALEDVEVVAATPAAPVDDAGQQRLAVGLRVTLRQAVFLAAAQAFAREVRILARAPGDSGRSRSAMTYDDRLVTRSSP
jgi:pilus assembly protein CpaB